MPSLVGVHGAGGGGAGDGGGGKDLGWAMVSGSGGWLRAGDLGFTTFAETSDFSVGRALGERL